LALAYVMDDTLRYEAQQQKNNLQLAQERAELVASFIRHTAHEFRTPLSVIQTSLYLLNRLVPSEKTTELSQKIQSQADSILKLVEALTTMIRLDSASQDESKPVNLNVVLRNTLDKFQEALAAKHLAFTLNMAESVTTVMGDASELELAFNALIENAIRYTPSGGAIAVNTSVEADQVKISIRDNGQGMTPDVLAQAFDRFFRADEAHSTRGFGLGLPIARKIIENHQGSITAESEPGVGSTFTVMLPIRKKTT
jgi:signal transduction histidine kinase